MSDGLGGVVMVGRVGGQMECWYCVWETLNDEESGEGLQGAMIIRWVKWGQPWDVCNYLNYLYPKQ